MTQVRCSRRGRRAARRRSRPSPRPSGPARRGARRRPPSRSGCCSTSAARSSEPDAKPHRRGGGDRQGRQASQGLPRRPDRQAGRQGAEREAGAGALAGRRRRTDPRRLSRRRTHHRLQSRSLRQYEPRQQRRLGEGSPRDDRLPRARPSSALGIHFDHGLADHLAVDQGAERFGRTLHREAMRDVRPHHAERGEPAATRST